MLDIGTILTNAGIPAAIEAIKEFLEKIVGPVAEETGLLLQDKVRNYRLVNQIKMLSKAQNMLNDAGINPTSIPFRTLLPLLEGAALEDDENMSTKWAALLDKEDNPNSQNKIFPGFPYILRQLSPLEAKLIDSIYNMYVQQAVPRSQWIEIGANRESIIKAVNISREEYDLITDNLIRLGLCSGEGTKLNFIEKKEQIFQLKNKGIIFLTQLGFKFITACKEPPKKTVNKTNKDF